MLTYGGGGAACVRMVTDGDGWSRSDTATDEAIRAAISAAARVIVVRPPCGCVCAREVVSVSVSVSVCVCVCVCA
jgi:hypothetical protein